MPGYRLSRLAEADMHYIEEYSVSKWGAEQALRYVSDLDSCFRLLLDNPGIGRNCDEIRSGYRRMERGSHVIFYRVTQYGILILRVLHKRMLPSKTKLP